MELSGIFNFFILIYFLLFNIWVKTKLPFFIFPQAWILGLSNVICVCMRVCVCMCVCVYVCVCVCVHVCSVTRSCLTLCNPMDYSPQGFSVHGIFKVRILQQVTISYPGDLPDLETWPESLRSLALAGRFFITAPPGKLLSDARSIQIMSRFWSKVLFSYKTFKK